MARIGARAMLRATRRSEMDVVWTAASFAVFASGVVLAAYILAGWLGVGRH